MEPGLRSGAGLAAGPRSVLLHPERRRGAQPGQGGAGGLASPGVCLQRRRPAPALRGWRTQQRPERTARSAQYNPLRPADAGGASRLHRARGRISGRGHDLRPGPVARGGGGRVSRCAAGGNPGNGGWGMSPGNHPCLGHARDDRRPAVHRNDPGGVEGNLGGGLPAGDHAYVVRHGPLRQHGRGHPDDYGGRHHAARTGRGAGKCGPEVRGRHSAPAAGDRPR